MAGTWLAGKRANKSKIVYNRDMNKKIIIGNWKMNPTSSKEARKLFSEIDKKAGKTKNTEVVVCVPFVYLENLKKIAKNVALGAQDLFYEERGAYTGEISALMLADLGVKYVLIGHSERRKLGETNLDVNKKIKAALFAGLRPIVCVGETERDEHHEYFNVVKNQVKECLSGVGKDLLRKIIIAYEPVWALSTTSGRHDATSADAREMSVFIKKILTDKFGLKTKLPVIIYGGSVNEKNCRDFLLGGGVAGCLPGAASLRAEKFLAMIKITEEI